MDVTHLNKLGFIKVESNKLNPNGKKGFVTFVVYPKPMNKEFYNVQANCILQLKKFKCTKTNCRLWKG